MLQKRNVVDTYEDMYTKEILSRSLYRFTARDKTKILADFEGAETITKWGIATDISYSTENIQGNQSLNV